MLRVHHADGPLAGAENDVSLAAPRTPRRLQYAPAPEGEAITAAGYFLIGYDDDLLVGPYRGLVVYELDRNASQLQPHPEYDGMEEGDAVYREAPGEMLTPNL